MLQSQGGILGRPELQSLVMQNKKKKELTNVWYYGNVIGNEVQESRLVVDKPDTKLPQMWDKAASHLCWLLNLFTISTCRLYWCHTGASKAFKLGRLSSQ